MEKTFINQQNVKSCSQQLFSKFNHKNFNQEKYRDILKILVNNMRTVFSKLNQSKITNSNIHKVLDVFKKKSINLTVQEIQNSLIKIPQRPESQKKKKVNFNLNNQVNGIDNFQPINNYDNRIGTNSNDVQIKKRSFEDYLAEREVNIPTQKNMPNNAFIPPTKNVKHQKKIKFDNKPVKQGNFLTSNDFEDDFASSNFTDDNFSKNLPKVDETEDVNKKLIKLQQERGNMLENKIVDDDSSSEDNIVDKRYNNILEDFNNNIEMEKEIEENFELKNRLIKEQRENEQRQIEYEKRLAEERDNNYKEQYNQLKQVELLQQQLQSQMNQSSVDKDEELLAKINDLNEVLRKYKKENKKLKKQLKSKNSIIDTKKKELRNELNKLKLKNSEVQNNINLLNEKEEKIENLIEENKDILSINKTNFITENTDNGEYTFHLDNMLTNIKKIELLSYDFSSVRHNINKYNNKIHINENTLELPIGNYTHSNIVEELNKLSEEYKWSFSKKTYKVSLVSDDNFTLYKKDNSILPYLGFIKDEYNDVQNIQGEKPCDLRELKYVKLYINNSKFGDLNLLFNNDYSKIYDNVFTTIDKINIELRDHMNNLVSIDHKLEFIFYDIQNLDNNMFINNDSSDSISDIDSDDIKEVNETDMELNELTKKANSILLKS